MTTQQQDAFEDFRVFLWHLWRFLGLPEPTPRQYEMADSLQRGDYKRLIVCAYRGVGKSWITAAFVVWLLWRDRDEKILVVSASKDRADAFSVFVKRIFAEWGWVRHLSPDSRHGCRDALDKFDVMGCNIAQAPSVKSVGIFGQITGSRATKIIFDDVEVPKNADTVLQREKLLKRITEGGGAVLSPGPDSRVIMLGTPQTEETVYQKLRERGYTMVVFPARIPEDLAAYQGTLHPFVQEMIDAGAAAGTPTDPQRFDDAELMEREQEYGRSEFRLQFMLDTSLSDALKHPLKLGDLVVMDLDPSVAPEKITWASGDERVIEGLPLVGLAGDRYHSPMYVAKEHKPYDDGTMAIDPSGRGADETGYAIVKALLGKLFLLDAGGISGSGYEKTNMRFLAYKALDYGVNSVVIEDNFGDGMFTELFKNAMREAIKERNRPEDKHPRVEEVKHTVVRKELRIVEDLEPVMNQHKLVVDKALIQRDFDSCADSLDPHASSRRLFYQMTHLTRERDCLRHDDRLETLGVAVRNLQRHVRVDAEKQLADAKRRTLDRELQKFRDHAFQKRGQRPPAKGWSKGIMQYDN